MEFLGHRVTTRGMLPLPTKVQAVQEKNSSFLKLALNYGVDANTPNSAGVTALHLVCYVESYDYEVAHILVSSGAQPALAVTSAGLTPLN